MLERLRWLWRRCWAGASPLMPNGREFLINDRVDSLRVSFLVYSSLPVGIFFIFRCWTLIGAVGVGTPLNVKALKFF